MKPPTNPRILVLALLAASLPSACGLGPKPIDSFNASDALTDLDGTRTFNGCEEIRSYFAQLEVIKKLQEAENRRISRRSDSREDASSSSPESSGSPESFALQEADVLEDDKLQIGANQMYYLQTKSKIIVIDRKSLAPVGSIDLGVDTISSTLYLSKGKLIAVSLIYPANVNPGTRVKIFETNVEQGALPALLKSIDKAGSYQTSRLVKDTLVLQTSKYLAHESLSIHEDRLSGVSCSDIMAPNTSAFKRQDSRFLPSYANSMSLLFSINVQTQAELGSLGAIGYSNELYMTASKIFLSSGIYTNAALGTSTVATQIHQINFDEASGKFELYGTGYVPGRSLGKWAFKYVQKKDQQDSLLIATTDFLGGNTQNSLFALAPIDHKLQIMGKLPNIGHAGETIRAVRYVNDTAYIVTFRTTDPLYAIDFSNPRDLKVMGELQIPGFSSMLYPFKDGLLIGVGNDTNEAGRGTGIKLSLFDVHQSNSLKEIDKRIFGADYSSAGAQWDSHSLYVDEELNLIGLPARVISHVAHPTYPNYKSLGFEQSGVLFQRILPTGMVDEARHSHKDFFSQECWKRWTAVYSWWGTGNNSLSDIDRVKRVDDRVLMFSPFGITAASKDGLTRTHSQKFEWVDNQECQDSHYTYSE
jgi:inhibitor of cysteine peptidase